MTDKTLREGDTLVIPKGWTITFRGGTVSIRSPKHMGESRRGFSFGDFFHAAAQIGRERGDA